MATLKQITSFLERKFPERLRADWDFTEGFVAKPRKDRPVRKAILSLELRENLLSKKADLMILHHPPKFGKKKEATNPFFRLFGKRVPIYSLHSRLDSSGFVGTALARKIFSGNLSGTRALPDGTVIASLSRPPSEKALLGLLKRRLGLAAVQFMPTEKGKKIQKVAIHGGEGFNRHHVALAMRAGVDAYLAGGISHHSAESAAFNKGVFFADIGHFSEQEGMNALAKLLASEFPGVRFEYVPQKPWWSVSGAAAGITTSAWSRPEPKKGRFGEEMDQSAQNI